jgi:Uma2 family endonuclease
MATATAAAAVAERHVLLANVGWETYQNLLADDPGRRTPRLTYDRGNLELVSPSLPHEADNRIVALLVDVVAAELGIDVFDVGSTTFTRRDLQRGFEADSAFYVSNAARVRGQSRIDLAVDPPPDLIVEVEITNPVLDKPALYAAMGVPELWRLGRGGVTLLRLDPAGNAETATSDALPPLTRAVIERFVVAGRSLPRPAWRRQVQAWVRGERGSNPPAR